MFKFTFYFDTDDVTQHFVVWSSNIDIAITELKSKFPNVDVDKALFSVSWVDKIIYANDKY